MKRADHGASGRPDRPEPLPVRPRALRFAGLLEDRTDQFTRKAEVALLQAVEEGADSGYEAGSLGGEQHTGKPGYGYSTRLRIGPAERVVYQYQTAAGMSKRKRYGTGLARVQAGERRQVLWPPHHIDPTVGNRLGCLVSTWKVDACRHFVADHGGHCDPPKQTPEQVECTGRGKANQGTRVCGDECVRHASIVMVSSRTEAAVPRTTGMPSFDTCWMNAAVARPANRAACPSDRLCSRYSATASPSRMPGSARSDSSSRWNRTASG